MKSKKNDWIDDVLNSTEGIERAQPSEELFNTINNSLYPQKKAKVVGLQYWVRTAAASIALLTLNIFAMAELNQTTVGLEDLTETTIPTIMTDFKLYE